MSLEFSIKKGYGGFSLDVSLALKDELMVLFGPSGAGKSLCLKLISGIERPDEGVVRIGGATVFDSSSGADVPMRDRRVGFLFQDYSLFEHMNVGENIAYGISHLGRAELGRRVGELVDLMRLGGLEGRYPHELSGGQKQRTALARTLAVSPRILLLDEPFSALDYQVREKLRADLARIHELYNVTTILVTHDLEEAFMLGERVAVINEGSIEQEGAREEVFYRPRTRNVARFMGVRNIFSGRVVGRSGLVAEIDSPGLGPIRAGVPDGRELGAGREVGFCIRPEEILVVRPDRVMEGGRGENIIEGVITGTVGMGSTHILYMEVSGTGALLKVELPNFVLRKLALATHKRISVLLKKESIWIIP